mgnify:CR=1 FL=1
MKKFIAKLSKEELRELSTRYNNYIRAIKQHHQSIKKIYDMREFYNDKEMYNENWEHIRLKHKA